MNRADRRAMARCKHQIATKTNSKGEPCLRVCTLGCGWEQRVEPEDDR